MSKYFPDLTKDEYAGLLARLLPRGAAIVSAVVASGLSGILDALGSEFARYHNLALTLLDEADVTTTTGLIDRWEGVLGLPGTCDPSPPTLLAERRATAHAALIRSLGSDPDAVIGIAEAAGYVASEIQIGDLFRADESASDERAYDSGWAFVWFIWATTTPALGWARLACLLQPVIPSHSVLVTIDGLGANEVTTPT